MPVYPYKCDGCGFSFDDVRTIAMRDQTVMCPKCAGTCSRQIARLHTDRGYSEPMLSDALGIDPSQISEAKQWFPHHEFASDGRMIIRSHQEFKRVLKDLGYHDRKAFC